MLLDWVIYLPLAIPLVGSLWLSLRTWDESPRTRAALAFGVLIASILAVLVNLAPLNHQALVSDWAIASFALSFGFDSITAVLLLTIFVLLLSVWLVTPRKAETDLYSTLIVFNATLMIMAGTPITVYFALTLMDLAFFGWRMTRQIERDTAVRSLAVGSISGGLWLSGTLLLGNQLASSLLTLGLWARLGVYPFHWLYPMRGIDSRDLIMSRAVPFLSGASLWLRSPSLLPEPALGIVILVGLAALLVPIAGQAREEQPGRAAIIGSSHAAALVPITFAFAGAGAVNAAMELALGSVVALAFFECAIRWRAEISVRWSRILWLCGVAALAGVPPLPGFFGRIAIYGSLLQAGQFVLLIAAVISTILIVPLVWSYGSNLKGAESRRSNSGELAVVGLLGGWTLFVGIIPLFVPEVSVDTLRSTFLSILLQVSFPNMAVAFVLILLPLFFAPILGKVTAVTTISRGSFIHRLAGLVELEWLPGSAAVIAFQTGAIARNLTAFAEENAAVWILLVALWVAILVLVPR